LDFQLNEEQLQLKKSVREFAEREIAPHVMQWDEASDFPLAVVKELGKLGLLGIVFPSEYGGAGMGYVEYVTAIEELSKVDGSVGIIVAAHTSLCSNHIFLAGSEEQKKKYISKLATGEFIGAWGLTEPSSGSDAGSARMTAVRRGGNWVLNGAKTFCTNGHYADVVVVIAVTDRAAHTHGLSAFVVEKGTKGFRPGKKENKLGLRASEIARLGLDDIDWRGGEVTIRGKGSTTERLPLPHDVGEGLHHNAIGGNLDRRPRRWARAASVLPAAAPVPTPA